jgi:hypothetical protein
MMQGYKKLKSYRYSFVLAIITIATVGLFKFIWNRMHLRVFAVVVTVGTFAGLTWQSFIQSYDSKFNGWWYLPNKSLGHVGRIAIEDILFYTICGAFFYGVYSILPKFKYRVVDCYIKYSLLFVSSILGALSFWLFEVGGYSSTLWFMIPGMILFVDSFHNIDGKRFLLFGLFMVIVASAWDIWFRDWQYIDQFGNHSTVWLNYSSNKWAWINGKNPIEVTPWFSFCGWWFIASLVEWCNAHIKVENKKS